MNSNRDEITKEEIAFRKDQLTKDAVNNIEDLTKSTDEITKEIAFQEEQLIKINKRLKLLSGALTSELAITENEKSNLKPIQRQIECRIKILNNELLEKGGHLLTIQKSIDLEIDPGEVANQQPKRVNPFWATLTYPFSSFACQARVAQENKLRYAAQDGEITTVRFCLSRLGVNINGTGGDASICNIFQGLRGMTALHMAVMANKFNVVKYLIEMRAKTDLLSAGGHTALDLAVKNRLPEIVEFLAEMNAVQNTTTSDDLKNVMRNKHLSIKNH